ncbi:XdhC family protein [Trujillonella humicola]|uniref:XdhC family protein n=1 Tax=Trujillonella humicola TaxID=3383699 RepID=UPI003905AFC8
MTVADLAAELSRSRQPFVQATVVRAQKPASAHAGDTALVRADGRIDGFVGGTCAESSVREYGLMTLSTHEPLLLRIVPGEQLPRTSEEGAVTVANPCLSGGSVEIFLEPRVPAPRLLVVGDSPIAQALVALGAPLGFDAVAAGEDDAPAAEDAALVVASHGRGEEPALTAALRLGVPYVGLVASRIRGAAVLAALDVPDDQRSRVHSPAGLDIGARTAAEIALSVLAEIVQERRAAERFSADRPVAASPAAPARAVDPVCGMGVAAVEASPHAEVGGVTAWFCCTGCRDRYVADPERYATAS